MEQTSYLFASATNAELSDLSNQVRQAIVKAALADDYLSAETQAIETTVSQMMSGLNKPKGKALTQKLEQADALRDRLFKALVFILRGLIFWDKDPRNEAALKLNDVIKVHGTSLTRMSYEKENAHLDAIKLAMQAPEMVQAFTDAGLAELWDELIVAHDSFTSMYRESAAHEATKGTIASASSLRGALYEQLKGLIEYLNVMSRVNTAVYGALQAEVNELAGTLNTKIQMRLGHRAASDSGDETSETTEII